MAASVRCRPIIGDLSGAISLRNQRRRASRLGALRHPFMIFGTILLRMSNAQMSRYARVAIAF
jgi:hypothetical protein